MSDYRTIKEKKKTERIRRKNSRNAIILLSITAVSLLVAGILFTSARPLRGQEQPILGRDHVAEGELADQVSPDPPTSGSHYEVSAAPGFYDEPISDGYLVHSLEHGYVILSYNCDALDQAACDALAEEVRATVDRFDEYKIIGVPRPGMPNALTLTSWGRIEKMDAFDASVVHAFIRANRGKAPEPHGA